MSKQWRFIFSFVSVLLPIFLYSLFRFSIGPLLPSIQSTYSVSVAVSGSLVSASTGFIGIGTALSGYLSSKIGEKKSVLLGLLVFSIPLGGSVLSKNLSYFAPLFVLSGLGGGLMTTPTYAVAATLLPKRKGAAVGFVSSVYNLGGFIGPSLSGFLLAYVGWQFPFLCMMTLGIVFAFLFQIGLRSYTPPPRDRNLSLTREFASLATNRNIVAVAVSMMLADFAFLSYATYTVQYIGTRFNLDQSALLPVDLYFGIAVGLGGIGIIIAGFIYDRLGGKTTSLISGGAAALSSFALYSVNSFLSAIVVMFLVGFFINWFWGVLSAMAQANVPEFSRSSAVSFVQTVAFIGAFFGPIFAAFLFGNEVSSGPLLVTVSAPFLLFIVLISTLYSSGRQLHLKSSD